MKCFKNYSLVLYLLIIFINGCATTYKSDYEISNDRKLEHYKYIIIPKTNQYSNLFLEEYIEKKALSSGFSVILPDILKKIPENDLAVTLIANWRVSGKRATNSLGSFSQEITVTLNDYFTGHIVYRGVGEHMGNFSDDDLKGAMIAAIAGISSYKGYIDHEAQNKEIEKPSDESVSIKPNILCTGTGFFVSPAGHILTNNHVIENASRILVYYKKNTYPATLLIQDQINDIALIKTEIKSKEIQLTNRNSNKGAEVASLGYPLIGLQGNELKITFGHINSLTGLQNDIRYMQVDTPIQPGNSGGPLVNFYGEVAGIVTAALSQEATLLNSGVINQNVNYAIKIDYALPILRQAGITPQIKTQRKLMTAEDIAKKLEDSVILIISTN